MTEHGPVPEPGRWAVGALPPRVRLGPGSLITGELAFKRLHSRLDPALVIGAHCTMDGVHFAIGEAGRITIGDYCCFTNVVLLAELEVCIGSYVVIGWNTTIADTDFHPVSPAERVADAIACSPLGAGRPRPVIPRQPVVIGDDVWIGPNAAILKGVRIGSGSFVEPGAVVTRDVPPDSRVLGNPARIVGRMP
jgi:acetyltransferase-like isoleucine patch superfamily enzyme